MADTTAEVALNLDTGDRGEGARPRASSFPEPAGFRDPRPYFEGLSPDRAADLISAGSDLAMVVSAEGVIRDVARSPGSLGLELSDDWVGLRWVDTVTVESRPKVEQMLEDARRGEATSDGTRRRWRQVNYKTSAGIDVPVQFIAVGLNDGDDVLALGRDLRPLAQLQQRLVETQQSIERDYLRLRHYDTRYRLLFHSIAEAIVVADASTLAITELNPAASRMLGKGEGSWVGQALSSCFAAAAQRELLSMLGAVAQAGRADPQTLLLAAGGEAVRVSASLFRHDSGSQFLLRLAPLAQEPARQASAQERDQALMRVVERMPDAFVVCDLQGRVMTANTAFVDLVQLSAPAQVLGQNLQSWLGRESVDFNVILVNLRQHGFVRHYATTLQSEYGVSIDVDISATLVDDAEQPCVGLTLRDVGRPAQQAQAGKREALRHSVAQLTELVGRVPLKDIVGETTEMIEQMCIEAALQLTGDNRASASEMLGLSRQSLYVKLRRYGLSEASDE
jgi:transcriptional regulator PpsR